MRDPQKIVGMTVHQSGGRATTEQETIIRCDGDPAIKLGSKLTEAPYKAPDSQKKKKDKLPPSDWVGKACLNPIDPTVPFSIFLWYQPQEDELKSNQVCIVDLLIDGKKSRGWVLEAGRKNGVCISNVEKKGSFFPLEFKSSAIGAKEDGFQGMIQATFWRVMQSDDGFIPDEGEKAIAIIQMHYKFNSSKKLPLQRVASIDQASNQPPQLASTFFSSPIVDANRVFQYKDLHLISSSERDMNALPDKKAPRPKSKLNGMEVLASCIEEESLENVPPEMVVDVVMDVDATEDTEMTLHKQPPPPLPQIQSIENATLEKQPQPSSYVEHTKNRKRTIDQRGTSSELNTTTPYRKRIPMTLRNENQSTILTLRITLDHTSTRSTLQAAILSFLEQGYEDDVLCPEDAKSIQWFGDDGVCKEWGALDDQGVFQVEGLVIVF